MNGKHYSEGNLSNLIDVARQYIDVASVRESIIAKCYQELGMIVSGAPVHQRASITLTNEEDVAMRTAIQRWRQESKRSGNKSG
jgi:hypothetical protein